MNKEEKKKRLKKMLIARLTEKRREKRCHVLQLPLPKLNDIIQSSNRSMWRKRTRKCLLITRS